MEEEEEEEIQEEEEEEVQMYIPRLLDAAGTDSSLKAVLIYSHSQLTSTLKCNIKSISCKVRGFELVKKREGNCYIPLVVDKIDKLTD